MRKFKGSELQTNAFTGKEKARLALMALTVVVIVGVIVYSSTRGDERSLVDVEEEVVARVELPEIPIDELRTLVDDRSAEARVRLERPAVARLAAIVRRLTPAHYEALETELLDPALAERIAAEPAEWRGRALSARGRLVALATRRPTADAQPEQHLTLALEGGGHAHGVALNVSQDLAVGDWARLDGLFLKVYADELPESGWVEAPLLVGARLAPSFEPLEPRPTLRSDDLELVVDDTLQRTLGLDGPGRYELLAHARDASRDAHDFAAAPALDRDLLSAVFADGASHRGAPFRLPISRVEIVRHLTLGENPARLDRITELWIANTEWDREMPVIGIHLPGQLDGIAKGDLVTGELVFYKNYAFDSVGTRRVAPFFVALSVQRFDAPEPVAMKRILWIVAGITAALVVLLSVLVRRDRRRAEAFEREQVERRQRRRAAGVARTP